MNIQINDKFEVLINKTGKKLDFLASDCSKKGLKFVFEYGLKQCLNDSHSSIKRSDFTDEEKFKEAVHEAVDKKIKAIMDGTLTIRQGAVRYTPEMVFLINVLTPSLGVKKATEQVKALGADGASVKVAKPAIKSKFEAWQASQEVNADDILD